jgi:glycosyltransferase involved in cell wall biosynthesis
MQAPPARRKVARAGIDKDPSSAIIARRQTGMTAASQPYRILMVARRPVHPSVLSGTPHFMREALARHVGQVDVLDDLVPECSLRTIRKGGLDLAARAAWVALRHGAARLRGRRYDWDRSAVLARHYGRRIERRLQQQPYDLVFADKAFVELACLRTALPVLYSHDAVYRDLMGYDRTYERLTPASVAEALDLERRATARAALCVYSSAWAARSAQHHLGLPEARLRIAYTGPNLEERHLPDDASFVPRATTAVCHLLLVGVDWHRKGCALAVEASRLVQQAGVPCVLTLVGARPPRGVALPEHVTLVPRLDKSDPAGLRALLGLYRAASFFILPSRAECLSMAHVEAMAFGLPCLGANVGGTAEIIDHNRNGFLLAADAGPRAYAERIVEAWRDPARYTRLSEQARLTQRTRFTWDRWGRALRACADEITTRARKGGP